MTEEEKKELVTLRVEKRQRIQQTRAQAVLDTAGIPASLTSLLAGTDDADTDKRAQDFCTAYQAALSEDVRKRLPQQSPVVTAPSPQRPKRGAHRM